MQTAVMAWTGYWVGLGIELFVIVVAGVILVLELTGVLFDMLATLKFKMAEGKQKRLQRAAEKRLEREKLAAERERLAAEREAERLRQQEAAEAEAAAAAAAAEAAAAELAAAQAAHDAAAEAAAAERLAAAQAAQAEAEAAEAQAAASSVTEETTTTTTTRTTTTTTTTEEETATGTKGKKGSKKSSKKVDEAEAEAAAGEVGSEVVYVQGDGVAFAESKSITELYEELSAEQKGYFDELREEALSKPDTELNITRNFVAVKIGKRNLIKLLIKRGVTVAEFMLENEQLKQLRLSNKNRSGKSAIKVKPTVVQVLDLNALKVAIDMIALSYEEIMAD